MICFDVEVGDDVMRPGYVTSGGDLFCDRCGSYWEEEEMSDEDAVYDYGPDPLYRSNLKIQFPHKTYHLDLHDCRANQKI